MTAVVAGFLSLTEVEAGHHRSYNEWHLFDHLPEQLPLPGLAGGQRWVLTPALRAHAAAAAPLDRVHYATLYLMEEPLDETVRTFRRLGAELHAKGRFHEHRTAHLAGPVRVQHRAAAERVLVSAAAVPWRPHRGVHVRVGPAPDVDVLLGLDGVAGVWTFDGGTTLDGTLTWCWLDGDPLDLAPALVVDAPFAATLETVDPWGPWDWFD